LRGLALLVIVFCPLVLWATEANSDAPVSGGPRPLGNVTVRLSPAAAQVLLGDEFDVQVVIAAGANWVTAADVHLSFDAAHLRITAPPTAGSPFVAMGSRYSNTEGTLDFGGVILGSHASGDVTLCTLHLRAVAVTGGAPAAIAPRWSDPQFPEPLLVADPFGNDHVTTWGGDGSIVIRAEPGLFGMWLPEVRAR
jgi:hypothetical protein